MSEGAGGAPPAGFSRQQLNANAQPWQRPQPRRLQPQGPQSPMPQWSSHKSKQYESKKQEAVHKDEAARQGMYHSTGAAAAAAKGGCSHVCYSGAVWQPVFQLTAQAIRQAC